MIDPSRCPPEQVVADYAAGHLSEEDVTTFEEHLAQCLACKEATEWVRFHFFSDVTDDESSVVETGRVVEDDESSVSLQIDANRFDMSLLMPTSNPSALGRLGQYDVLQLIGYGGMGVVFKAYDDRLRRTVAIKALNRGLASNSTARRRFIREGWAAAAISHPNTVIIYQVEDHQDQPFLVMEYIGGGTLRDRLRKERRLEPMSVLRIGSQIAAALQAAHRRGIVHRDVKPANIMLEDGMERVKITDFGLARVSIDNVELTASELTVGTPAYMAPEQVRGEKIDGRADLFALGCVLYAMLVGQSPFHCKSSFEVARRILEEEPIPPEELAEVTPEFLSEIIMRLLEKDPERRYQSAGEVAEILNAHLAALNQTPTDELNAVLHVRRSKPKRKSRVAKVVAIALIPMAIGLIGWFAGLFSNVPTNDPRAPQQSQSPDSDRGTSHKLADNATDIKPQLLARITVAKNGAADYSTLQDALERAEKGTTIEILDDATYDEILHIDREHQWAGIKVLGQADRPATISSKDEEIVIVPNTPGVEIRNLRLKAQSELQHVLLIGGNVPGLVFENVEFITDLKNEWSLVQITELASGTSENPIRITKCRFSSHGLSVVVNGNANLPVRHLQIVDNHFRLASTHLQFNRCVQALRVTGNVFQAGIGIAFGLVSDQNCNSLFIANNTFFQCEPWLYLRSSPPDAKNVVIANNLVLTPRELLRADRFSLSEYASQWSFVGNYCERREPANESESKLLRFLPEIAVLSCDPADAQRFLRLASDSALATGGAGGDLPSYVGAYCAVGELIGLCGES